MEALGWLFIERGVGQGDVGKPDNWRVISDLTTSETAVDPDAGSFAGGAYTRRYTTLPFQAKA